MSLNSVLLTKNELLNSILIELVSFEPTENSNSVFFEFPCINVVYKLRTLSNLAFY